MKQIFILQIEHQVTNFEVWKKAFDNDPARREQSGVLRYKILRPVDNMNYIIVDLEFDNLDKAEAFQAILQKVWQAVDGRIVFLHLKQGSIELVEEKHYASKS